MLVFCGYLVLYFVLVFYFLKCYFSVIWWFFVLLLFWMSVEWLCSWMLLGFFWLFVGYSQLNGWLNGWFVVIGEIGVIVLLLGLLVSIVVSIYIRCYIGSGIVVVIVIVGSVGLNQVNWMMLVEDVFVGMV